MRRTDGIAPARAIVITRGMHAAGGGDMRALPCLALVVLAATGEGDAEIAVVVS